MKLNVLIIICLAACQIAFGQDSLRIETVEDSTFRTPQYLRVYDDVFLTNQTTTRMFKYDPLSWLGQGREGTGEMKLEYERKLNTGFSLNSAASFNISNSEALAFYARQLWFTYSLTASIEPRWYVGMTKRIAEKQSANNLSGNYWGVQVGATVIPKGWAKVVPDFNDLNKIDTFNVSVTDIYKSAKNQKPLVSYRLSVNYGVQRRLFRSGFIDFSFGVGVVKEEAARLDDVATKQVSFVSSWRPFINNRVAFGLVFGGDSKQSKTKIESCDLFRCFEEEDRLLKINLLGLLKVLDTRNISAQTSISYETWLIKEKSISLATTVKLHRKYFAATPSKLNSPNVLPSENYIVQLTVEPRYYKDLKKRIAQGKSARNFSANYWALPIAWEYRRYRNTSNKPSDANDVFKNSNNVIVAVAYGAQRRLFRNGYYDISFGAGLGKYSTASNIGLTALLRAELGFAF